jgi:hypothetical protein
MMGAVLVLMLAAAPRPAYRPDPRLTPGGGEPVPVATLCTPGYASRRRHVTATMKRAVYIRYGLVPVTPHVVDHLIPLELGGTNDAANLWPQPVLGPYGSRAKDRLEGVLRAEVCAGRMTVEAAQDAFRGDWTRAYRRWFGAPKAGD